MWRISQPATVCVPMVFLWFFLWSPIVFLWFSRGVPWFSRGVLWFSRGFLWFSRGVLWFCRGSYRFRMVFLWFSRGFLWFSYRFFLGVSYGFPKVCLMIFQEHSNVRNVFVPSCHWKECWDPMGNRLAPTWWILHQRSAKTSVIRNRMHHSVTY